MAESSELITCPRCGEKNASTALVCTVCGARLPHSSQALEAASLDATSLDASSDAAAAQMAEEIKDETLKTEAADEIIDDNAAEAAEPPHEDIAREIDARRAHHLLERAFMLHDRYEFDAAILACRQALVLSPDSALENALLGFLLKRQGDATGAAKAYAKANEISSDKTWEQLSLDDLRAVFATDTAANAHKEETQTVAADAPPASPVMSLSQTAAALPEASREPIASKSIVVGEPISAARDKNWLLFAAMGMAVFVGLALLYRTFAAPTPSVRETTVINSGAPLPSEADPSQTTSPSNVVVNQSAPDGQNAQVIPADGQRLTAGNSPSAGQVAPPSAPSGATSGSASPPANAILPARQMANAPATGNVQPQNAVSSNSDTGAAPPATNLNSPSQAPPVASQPLPPPVASGGATAANNENVPDNSTSGTLPPPAVAPRSQGNSRPGTPQNSIPGAFQPGRP